MHILKVFYCTNTAHTVSTARIMDVSVSNTFPPDKNKLHMYNSNIRDQVWIFETLNINFKKTESSLPIVVFYFVTLKFSPSGMNSLASDIRFKQVSGPYFAVNLIN